MSFDPYAEWLDLPEGDRPPDPFALLAIEPTDDPDRIANAADHQIQRVRERAPWNRQREMRTTLSQILRARNLLLDPSRPSAILPASNGPQASDEVSEQVVVHFSEFVPDDDDCSEATRTSGSEAGNPEISKVTPVVPLPTAGEIISLDHLPGDAHDSKPEPKQVARAAETDEVRASDPQTTIERNQAAARRRKPRRRRPRKNASATSDSLPVTNAGRQESLEERPSASRSRSGQFAGVICVVVVVSLAGWLVVRELTGDSAEVVTIDTERGAISDRSHGAPALPKDIRETDRSAALVGVPDPTKLAAQPPSDDSPEPGIPRVAAKSATIGIAAPEFPSANAEVTGGDGSPTPSPDQVSDAGSSPGNVSPLQTSAGEKPAAALPAGPTTVSSVPAVSAPADPGTRQYAAIVREILATGFDAARTTESDIEALLTQASQLKPKDARADFAAGLAHWKRLWYDDARTSFGKAVECDPHYRWAWQAEIQILLKRKEFDEAFDRLSSVAVLIAASDENPDRAMASAMWMGRLVGFLTHSRNNLLKDAEKATQLDVKLQEPMSSEIRLAYLESKKAVHAEFAEQSGLLRTRLSELEKADVQRRASEKKKIEEEQQRLGAESADVKRTADQWKKWIDERLKVHGKELDQLSKSLTNLTTQAQSVSSSMSLITNQIITIELQSGRAQTGVPVSSQALSQLIVRRNQLVSDMAVLESRSQIVRQQATALLQLRQKDIEKYRKATGKLVSKEDSISKLESVLKRQDQLVDESGTANSGRSRSLRRRLYALDTYVPFDLSLEKSRLLSEFPAAAD